VPHDHNQHGARQCGGEFHAAQDVRIDHVAGDAGIEQVADSEIEEDLGRSARVDTAQHHPARVLTAGGCPLFPAIVSRDHRSLAKALIAFLREREELVRRKLVTPFPGKGGRVRLVMGWSPSGTVRGALPHPASNPAPAAVLNMVRRDGIDASLMWIPGSGCVTSCKWI
jgi:hypothetical protein